MIENVPLRVSLVLRPVMRRQRRLSKHWDGERLPAMHPSFLEYRDWKLPLPPPRSDSASSVVFSSIATSQAMASRESYLGGLRAIQSVHSHRPASRQEIGRRPCGALLPFQRRGSTHEDRATCLRQRAPARFHASVPLCEMVLWYQCSNSCTRPPPCGIRAKDCACDASTEFWNSDPCVKLPFVVAGGNALQVRLPKSTLRQTLFIAPCVNANAPV